MGHNHDSSQPMICIEGLTTHYGERRILDHIDLDVLPGETMVLLGASGVGKSTLLRHILLLERPSGGAIYIKGGNILGLSEDELNELRKRIGVSFQSGALFNSMTVGDNVALPLRELTRLEESTIQIMARIKLDLVGLSGFEDYMPAQISGGMRKRAAVARALALDPEILLFDEPSSGLDPITAAGIDALIIKLKKAFKMTIVVVTHELVSAFHIADRITLMHGGGILLVGAPQEIRESKHPRVQQFLNRVPEEEMQDYESYLRSLTSGS